MNYSATQDARAFFIVPGSVNGIFQLWAEIAPSQSTMPYASFRGFSVDNSQIWIRERSDEPKNSIEISSQEAVYLLDAYRKESRPQ